mmetsp:Transcript_11275/g.27145  ORF Transcript_11275/g.27145 Transcript_11275/m.27145 type:complete len:111 (-) Transcript_11275:1615-1947(-)
MEQAELKQESLMLSEGGKEEDGASDANADGDTDAIVVGNADGTSESLSEGAIDSSCFVVVGNEDGAWESSLLNEDDGKGDEMGWSEGTGVGGTVSPITTSASVWFPYARS